MSIPSAIFFVDGGNIHWRTRHLTSVTVTVVIPLFQLKAGWGRDVCYAVGDYCDICHILKGGKSQNHKYLYLIFLILFINFFYPNNSPTHFFGLSSMQVITGLKCLVILYALKYMLKCFYTWHIKNIQKLHRSKHERQYHFPKSASDT